MHFLLSDTRNMSNLFAMFCDDVAKMLNVTNLCPVTSYGEAKKFRQFAILQKVAHSRILKSDYIPVGYSLLQILEPNFPVPGIVGQGVEKGANQHFQWCNFPESMRCPDRFLRSHPL